MSNIALGQNVSNNGHGPVANERDERLAAEALRDLNHAYNLIMRARLTLARCAGTQQREDALKASRLAADATYEARNVTSWVGF